MRFFLNIVNGFGEAEDEEGIELPDLDAARGSAIDGIRSIVASEVKAGRIDLNGRIEILDERRLMLAVVYYREAFDLFLDQ